MQPTLKTTKRRLIEDRDQNIYNDWIEFTKNPESQRTAIADRLQSMYGLKYRREVYRMINRAKERLASKNSTQFLTAN